MRLQYYLPQPRFSPYVCYPDSVGHYYDDPAHGEKRAAGELLFYNLHLVFGGKGFIELDEQTIELKESMGFLYGPQLEQIYWSDAASPWDVRWVHFYGFGLETMLGGKGLDKAWVFRFSEEEKERLQYLTDKLYERANSFDFEKEAGLSLCLYELLLALLQNAEEIEGVMGYKQRTTLFQTAHWIRTHCHEPLSLTQMAEHAGYSRYYFNRIFHEVMRKTPIQFIHECRMLRAKQLLSSTEWSIKQISGEVGFSQSAYFIRCFRKLEGLTPLQFRELRRQVRE